MAAPVTGDDFGAQNGLLISPDMVKAFLLPYYQDVVGKARRRQPRRLFLHIDSDGWAEPAIPLYRAAGMDVMSPFEVAFPAVPSAAVVSSSLASSSSA